MADADTARLCTEIVRSVFGPLTATVASIILAHGRLGLSQILRFSRLKPRTVRASILVLVQHNLLWHAHSDDQGEVYEIDTDECLMRLRYGRYVWLAKQLYGKAGADVVELVLDHGKLRPLDIMSRLSIYDPVKAPAVLAQTLHKLVDEGYLKPSTVLSHHSPRDKRLRYEAEEKRKISGFPTAKELREAKEIAEARLRREEEEAEQVGMKRKARDYAHQSSKRKVVEEHLEVDDEIYFRVNCERFNVHIRNELIEAAASERYNQCAGWVLRATLKATESKQRKLSDIRSDPASLVNIAMHLPDDAQLAAGLALQSSKTPPTMTLMKEYLGILASADNPTPSGRAASFISLSGSKVQVEFEIIGRRLRRHVLESVARERHGDEGVRIIRLLLDNAMMDEKQISKVGMMAAKDVRPLLSAMSAESLVSLQEVPKSADRNPTRMFFLWFVDLQKAYNVLLGNMYKTLFNIAARRQAEQDEPNLKAVLEKRQRSDVSQDEERLLTRNERELLAQWERKREKLTVLEMRVEETVFILRDLGIFAINEE
ncbi:RNA polymerase III subunit RPC82-domain-containing protein [Fomes fomentarius]|nr:RNA polymerase III subunit RPC82-domain-containing protein [Fomes fomentarius]